MVRVAEILAVAGFLSGPALADVNLVLSPEARSSLETRAGLTEVVGTNLGLAQAGTPVDGGSFQSVVQIDPKVITFRNGAIGLGAYSRISSGTRLQLDVVNDGDEDVGLASFSSVIIPAGFGFFMPFVGTGLNCGPLTLGNCGTTGRTGYGFPDLARPGDIPDGVLLGTVGFDFSVLVDGSQQFALKATFSIVFDPILGTNILVQDFGDAPSVLNGFTLVTDPADEDAVGYAWDETPFSFDLPDTVLSPGEVRSILYVSDVFVETFANYPDTGISLLGYSAFGDPIGRPGGGGSLSSGVFGLGPLAVGITGVNVGEFKFVTPFFSNGVLFLPPAGGVIPEPASWAMLIAGFGLVGGTLRRLRAITA
jgi:hypothetical protein